VDSTILADAVATQDTVTQLVSAIRRAAREVPGAGERIAAVCTGHDYSAPGKPDLRSGAGGGAQIGHSGVLPMGLTGAVSWIGQLGVSSTAWPPVVVGSVVVSPDSAMIWPLSLMPKVAAIS
jgi:hypothetical protein